MYTGAMYVYFTKNAPERLVLGFRRFFEKETKKKGEKMCSEAHNKLLS
jgi:hypothetical protein